MSNSTNTQCRMGKACRVAYNEFQFNCSMFMFNQKQLIKSEEREKKDTKMRNDIITKTKCLTLSEFENHTDRL